MGLYSSQLSAIGFRRSVLIIDRVHREPFARSDWSDHKTVGLQCGLGHYRMRGEYHLVTADGWNRWQADELALLSR